MQKKHAEQSTGSRLQIRSVELIPELYSNIHVRDPIAYARFHASWAELSWYVFEWNGEDTFFGMRTQGRGASRSYGLYSLDALSKFQSAGGMAVVQDFGFQPTRLSVLRKKEVQRVWGMER